MDETKEEEIKKLKLVRNGIGVQLFNLTENGYSEKRAMLYLITNNYIIIKGNAKEISIAYGKYVKDLGKFKFN